MATPIDDRLIGTLHRKYGVEQPTEENVALINEKYGDDNEAYARDFLTQNVEEAKNDEWLQKELGKITRRYGSTSQAKEAPATLQDVKKKEETLESGGEDQKTPTTSAIEPPTEPPVSASLDSQTPTEGEEEKKPVAKIPIYGDNPDYDPKKPTTSIGGGNSKHLISYEERPGTEQLEPEVVDNLFNLEYNPLGESILGIDMPSALDSDDPNVQILEDYRDPIKREQKIKERTQIGGQQYYNSALLSGVLSLPLKLTFDNFENADAPHVQELMGKESLRDVLTDESGNLVLPTYDNVDVLTQNLQNKGFSEFEAQEIVEDIIVNTTNVIDEKITDFGNQYLTDTQQGMSLAFEEYRKADGDVAAVTNELYRYESEYTPEQKIKADQLSKEAHDGMGFIEYKSIQKKYYESILTLEALEYEKLSQNQGTQLYSPINNRVLKEGEKPSKDDQQLNAKYDIDARAKELLKANNNDVVAIEQLRRDAYFNLLYIGDKLAQNFESSLNDAGVVEQGWRLLTGEGTYGSLMENLPAMLTGNMPQLHQREQETFRAFNTHQNLHNPFTDEAYEGAGSEAGYLSQLKNPSDMVFEGFFVDGKPGQHLANNPLANAYNEALAQFQTTNQALVLNKNYIKHAEQNPEDWMDVAGRGFIYGATGDEQMGPKEEATLFVSEMAKAGIQFSDKEVEKLEATFTEETLHMGASIIPFLAEVALVRGAGNATGVLKGMQNYFKIRAAGYSSKVYQAGTRIMGAALEEAFVLYLHQQGFDGEMGAPEGFALAGGSSTAAELLRPLLRSKPMQMVPNLIQKFIDAQAKITGGVTGMVTVNALENVTNGVPIVDDEGNPTGEMDYTYGTALAKAFEGERGLIENLAQLYIVTGGLNLTKPRGLEREWRKALKDQINGLYGRDYARLPESVKIAYNTLEIGPNSTKEEIEEAYMKKAEKISSSEDIKGADEMTAMNRLTNQYNKAIQHKNQKTRIEEFLKETERIEKQEAKNEARYSASLSIAQGKSTKLNEIKTDAEGKREISLSPDNSLSAKEAEYWSKQSKAEIMDTFTYLNEQVEKGTISREKAQRAQEKITEARADMKSVEAAGSKANIKRSYEIINEIKELDQLLGDISKNNPTLEASNVADINAQKAKLEAELQEIANEQKVEPKGEKDITKLNNELSVLNDQREGLKFDKEDTRDIDLRIAEKKQEIEGLAKDLGIEGRFERGQRGDLWISEATGEKGKMGATEKPEFPDKEVTPKEIEEAYQNRPQTRTLEEPLELHKGDAGTKDIYGETNTRHPDAEGTFYSSDPSIAEQYKGEGEVEPFSIPKGATVERIEIDGSKMSPEEYNQAETDAINNSKADVVELVTIENRSGGRGTNKETQYIVKDKSTSDVKEPKPTEIPSKEQAPSAKTDAEKQPKAKPQEPTAESGKKKRLTSDDKKLQETYDNIEKNIVEKVNERNPGLSEKEKNNLAAEDALKYLQEDSEWYAKASDTEREAAVRDINSRFGIRQPRAIKVEDILGRNDVEGITVDEVTELARQIKAKDKAGKDVSKLRDKAIALVKAEIKGVKLTKSEQNKILSLLKGEKSSTIERVPDGVNKQGKVKYKEVIKVNEDWVGEIQQIVDNRKRQTAIDYITKNKTVDKQTTKKGVGTIPVDYQRALSEYLKENVIGQDLRGKSTEKLEEIAEVIESIVKEGEKKQQEKNKEEKIQKAKDQGETLSAVKEGRPTTKLETTEEIEAFVGADKVNIDSKTKNPLDALELRKPDSEKEQEVKDNAIELYKKGNKEDNIVVDELGNVFEVKEKKPTGVKEKKPVEEPQATEEDFSSYDVKDPQENPALEPYINSEVESSRDMLGGPKAIQETAELGKKLDADNANVVFKRDLGIVDGRRIFEFEVEGTGEKFLMYESKGEGTGPESKGKWVPLKYFAKDGWFVKGRVDNEGNLSMDPLTNENNPKLNKYGSETFKELAKKLEADAEAVKNKKQTESPTTEVTESEGEYTVELQEEYVNPNTGRTVTGDVEIKLPKNEPPTQEEINNAYDTKANELKDQVDNNEITMDEYISGMDKLKDAVNKLEKRNRQEEAYEKIETPETGADVIVESDGETYAISRENVKLLESEGLKTTGSKGYTREPKQQTDAKLRAIADFASPLGFRSIQSVQSLLANLKAKFPKLTRIADKIEADIINARYDQIADLRELGKELKKVRKDAGVSSTKLMLRPKKAIYLDSETKKPIRVTNDAIVDMYMTYKAEGAARVKASGVDVKALEEYMASQPALREYAEGLFDFYEKNSERFRDVYEKVMNKDWDEIRLDPDGNKVRYLPTESAGTKGGGRDFEDKLVGLTGITSDGEVRTSDNPTQSKNPIVSHFFDKHAQFKWNPETGQYESTAGAVVFSNATSKARSWAESMTFTDKHYDIYEDVQDLINPKTQADIKKALGKGGYRELVNRLYASLAPSSPATAGEQMLQTLNMLQISWMIGNKLKNIPKQAASTSIWLFDSVEDGVGPKAILKQFADVNNLSPENLKFMYDLVSSPQILERYRTGAIDPALSAVLSKRGIQGFSAKDLRLMTRLYVKISMGSTLVGDAAGVFGLGIPTALAYKAKYLKEINPETGKKYTREEAEDLAARKFFRKYNEVQQSGEKWTQSSLAESAIGKSLVTTYKSSQMAYINRLRVHTSTIQQAMKDPESVSKPKLTHALIGVLNMLTASATFTAVNTGYLADVMGLSEASDETKDRTRYEAASGIVKANLDGLGVVGMLANGILNELEGKGVFNNVPLMKYLQKQWATTGSYISYNQDSKEEIRKSLANELGLESSGGKYGDFLSKEMFDEVYNLYNEGKIEEAKNVMLKEREKTQRALDEAGVDEGEKLIEQAKIDKQSEAIEKLERFKEPFNIISDFIGKGNFKESMEAIMSKDESGFWKYALNIKDKPEDNWETNNWIYKEITGSKYKQIDENEAAAYDYVKKNIGYDLKE